jgi:ADP-ribose pyrophosphatase
MTNANMKLVLANVALEDKLSLPKQKLDDGEFIVPRVIELTKLHEELRGIIYFFHLV